MKSVLFYGAILLGYGLFAQRTVGQSVSDDQSEDLITASTHGDVVAVDRHLARGAGINTRNAAGSTALLAAANAGQTNVVAMLLAKGAEIEAKDTGGRTALIRAVIRGEAETVALLLKNGADVEAKDNEGNTVQSLAMADRQRAERHVKEFSGNAYFQQMAEDRLAAANEALGLVQKAVAGKR